MGYLRALSVVVGLGLASNAFADDAFKYKTSFFQESLKTIVYLKMSPDGKFLYTSQYGGTATLNVFEVGAGGSLTLRSTVVRDDLLCSALDLAISPDGKYVVVTAQTCGTVILYQRDPVKGGLTPVSFVKNLDDVPAGLAGVKRVDFSKDGKFIYVSGSDGVVVLALIGDQLEVKQVYQNPLIQNTRGIAVGDRYVYVSDSTTGTFFVFARDATTGLLTFIQSITKGALDSAGNPIRGLDYAYDIVISNDGSLVYTNAGRFGGESIVTVWKVANDGKLSVREQIIPGVDGVPPFTAAHFFLFSPGQEDLLLTAFNSNNVIHFRKQADGSLKYLETLDTLVATPAGLAMDPTGKYLFVASELSGGISVYFRER